MRGGHCSTVSRGPPPAAGTSRSTGWTTCATSDTSWPQPTGWSIATWSLDLVGVGLVEGGITAGLAGFGLDLPIATAAAVTYRAVSYWLPLLGSVTVAITQLADETDRRHGGENAQQSSSNAYDLTEDARRCSLPARIGASRGSSAWSP